MSSPVQKLMTDVITITRYATTVYSDVTGLPTVGAETVFDTIASVQPMSGNELSQLPEGQRTHNTKKLYTCDELFTASERNLTNSDKVTWRGIDFEVHETFDWQKTCLPHYKYFMVKIEPNIENRGISV